ncbi:MAG: beta-ketoacyl synthase [Flavobacteriales bacterium]|nr:beta-ketoacyl synthase [Flavobacteriales bacterium]
MANQVVIRGIGAVSPLGFDDETASSSLFNNVTCIQKIYKEHFSFLGAPLSDTSEEALKQFIRKHHLSKDQDRIVYLAQAAALQAVQKAGWNNRQNMAVNFGSSRGATFVWEEHYGYFLKNQKAKPKTSPLTTLGNISSQVAEFIGSCGIIVEHSVTCSTGMMSLLNGIAWLQSGMASHVLVGAAEAPLTPFTVAQMQSLGIYSEQSDAYPCKPLYFSKDKKNSMVLGEGAAALALEWLAQEELKPGDIVISGWGIYKETGNSPTGISPTGIGFQESMQQAIQRAGALPDVIIMHAPGTVLGDAAEYEAVIKLFGSNLPYLISQKWKVGHTLGASGLLGIQLAQWMFQLQQVPTMPYPTIEQVTPLSIRHVLINTMGFGGNTVSIMLQFNL